ncbi:ABC transporter substrate-binding protein [Marinomonas posidonica]|uniref:ABC-type transporter, periplasmic subunit n=1 Tax=Marinomonas posidonica (strain CECT 7376 / NCIMB 14433 / IVIA-Po-181) TaxID=491952 RepID=F6CUH6_MARPP|nr:ABC transporter substrate-binding protein [Marinomonas posidonica]AEF56396.1 ABC-type transporter, periplasmic subunit [Marinomonas posidonica IVIA-Po-181]
MTSHFRSILTVATTALSLLVVGSAVAAPRTDLVLGMSIEPSGLDPTAAAPVAIGQVVWQNLFEGLVTIDKDGNIEPELAENWDISTDGLTYTFDLRDNVTFQNGKPFNAQTAKYTLDRILAEDSVNPQKSLYKSIESVKALDTDTLVLTLSKPSADLLYWLGFPAAVMIEPSSETTNATDPVGTGPFKFSEWKKGNQVTLVENTNYWGKAPKLEQVVFRFIGDPQAQAAALISGGIDAIPEFTAPELVSQFEKNNAFETVIGTTGMEVIAGMNNARKPFNDVRVRQALMMATDRQAIIDATNAGLGTPIGSHFSPSDAGYEDLTTALPYDPAKAKQLLAEAGYPNGFTFTMKVPNRTYAERASEIMQAYFSMIGVTMKIETSEFPAKWVQDVFKDTNYDMTIIGHAEPLDIGIYARDPYYFNYDNPDFNKAMVDVSNATTEQERVSGYQHAQKILAQDVPALFLYARPKIGIWKQGLNGMWRNGPVPSNDVTDVFWNE